MYFTVCHHWMISELMVGLCWEIQMLIFLNVERKGIFTSRTRLLCSIMISELLNRNFHKGIQPFMETHCGDAVVSLHGHVHRRAGAAGLVTDTRRVKIPKLQTYLTSPHHWQQTAFVKNPRHHSRHYAFRDSFRRPWYWRIGPRSSLGSPRCGESSSN